MKEPESINIIEGPTPEFHPSPQPWLQSILEGPEDRMVAMCQLRTHNGADILERCQRAWQERRPVHLDYPDEMRLRQQASVLALRLDEVDEGPVLLLWVSLPFEVEEEVDDGEDDSFNL